MKRHQNKISNNEQQTDLLLGLEHFLEKGISFVLKWKKKISEFRYSSWKKNISIYMREVKNNLILSLSSLGHIV